MVPPGGMHPGTIASSPDGAPSPDSREPLQDPPSEVVPDIREYARAREGTLPGFDAYVAKAREIFGATVVYDGRSLRPLAIEEEKARALASAAQHNRMVAPEYYGLPPKPRTKTQTRRCRQ